ncbi:MAG TPA: rhodanese-like domain-containing protein [Kribbellaceae bacterium]
MLVAAGDVAVIDERPSEEYAAGHIPGASAPVSEHRVMPRSAALRWSPPRCGATQVVSAAWFVLPGPR